MKKIPLILIVILSGILSPACDKIEDGLCYYDTLYNFKICINRKEVYN